MNLSVDIGNTNVKIALYRDSIEVEYLQNPSLSEVEERLTTYQPMVVVSKTGSQPELEKLLNDYGAMYCNHRIDLPIRLDYETPETLGSDRIAAACGAHGLYPGSNIAIP